MTCRAKKLDLKQQRTVTLKIKIKILFYLDRNCGVLDSFKLATVVHRLMFF